MKIDPSDTAIDASVAPSSVFVGELAERLARRDHGRRRLPR